MRFDELGLAPEILRSITEQGYTDPTPIQQKAIPLVLAGHDLKACAQTGTGKTAAFTLPLLQRLLHHANSSPSPARHPVRALILAPTRELAIQVYENVKTYSQYTPFRSMVVYGGVDIKPQIAELKKGVEFLVATPGRLLDHVEQKTVSFNAVEALVLDEADRMLDMGFIPDIKRILNLLPGTRQSLLFSATFSDEIKKLADSMLREPVMVEVARQSSVSETISHRVHPVSAYDKRALLTHLLKSDEYEQVLVFTRTKQETGRLARELIRSGISADAIHGDKTQIERSKALDAFKNGSVKVLVATDVAARGLDIEELPHVINYELPRTPEDYVHRIGRTGRAGKKGKAISLVSGEEVGYLVDIEKLIKLKIEQVVITGFEPDADYEYPPSGKRKKPAHSRSDDQSSRSSRSKKHEKHEEAKEKHERGHERNERRPRPQKLSPQKNIAADGFDFSKPYEPRSDVPASPQKPDKPDPHKPKRAIPALLGGMGRK